MNHHNIPNNTLVKIVWVDSSFEMGWRYQTKPAPLPEIVTVGFVTRCDKEMLETAATVGGKGVLNALALPWGMVKKIKVLHG